jgi:hypothetical protein
MLLTREDIRFAMGVITLLIAPGYIGYAPLPGQIAGGLLFLAGLLVCANN